MRKFESFVELIEIRGVLHIEKHKQIQQLYRIPKDIQIRESIFE